MLDSLTQTAPKPRSYFTLFLDTYFLKKIRQISTSKLEKSVSNFQLYTDPNFSLVWIWRRHRVTSFWFFYEVTKFALKITPIEPNYCMIFTNLPHLVQNIYLDNLNNFHLTVISCHQLLNIIHFLLHTLANNFWQKISIGSNSVPTQFLLYGSDCCIENDRVDSWQSK